MFEDSTTVLLLTCLVLVPVFTVLAYRGWARKFRGKPSSSRSMIGLISLLSVFCSWVLLAIFLCLLLVHSSWAEFFPTYWAYGPISLSLLGTLLALALKGSSRILTLLAGFFLASTLWLVYGPAIDAIKH